MKGIKKKGFVLIYVFILIVPVMMISGALMDLTLMNFKTNINIINKQQSYYNAEAGMLDAVKRYKFLTYDIRHESIYYMNLSQKQIITLATSPQNENFVRVKVSYKFNDYRIYSIEALGCFKGCEYKLLKSFTE